MNKGGRISEKAIEDASACIADKKNPDKCIDKVMEEHGLDEDDKPRLLTKVAKRNL